MSKCRGRDRVHRVGTGQPYVDSQRDSKAFGHGPGKVLLSADCGHTWPHRAPFAEADDITFSCILRDGNVLFATLTGLFLGQDDLATITPITVRDRDGADLLPHTPSDPDRPGWYFHALTGQSCWDVHTVTYNPVEDAFYACTGDHDRDEGLECHWLRGTYDAAADTWDWRVIVTDRTNSRYKSGGITFVDGACYWISDSNGPPPYDRGVFRCAPEDITRPERHERLYDPGVEAGCMIEQDGVFLAGHCAPASDLQTGIIVSTDAGRTWAQVDLAECGPRSPVRFHEANSDGWFRVDLRTGWIDSCGEVLFIKPKR